MTQTEIFERAQQEFPQSDLPHRMGFERYQIPAPTPAIKRIVVGEPITDQREIHRRWNAQWGEQYPITLTYVLDGEERTVTGFHVACYWSNSECWIDRTQLEMEDGVLRQYLELLVLFVLNLLLEIHGDELSRLCGSFSNGMRHLRALS